MKAIVLHNIHQHKIQCAFKLSPPHNNKNGIQKINIKKQIFFRTFENIHLHYLDFDYEGS